MLSVRSDIDPDRIFSSFDLTRGRAVLAAVSGGSDSLAMLLLLQRRLAQEAPQTRLMAATVDHGLRSESRAEAETVARFCASRGIAHRILTWTDAKPATGIAAAARLARYELLAEAAASAGADMIVTGHTAEDQAETVAMRGARGDGRGVAGMAPATLFGGTTWIVRPLLGERRERLRALLRDEGVAWIDDPTNVNMRYERAQIRRALQDGSGESGHVEALVQRAAQAAAERQALGSRAAVLIERHAQRPLVGLVRLAPEFAREDDAGALLAFRALLAVTGGVEQLPEARRAAALLGRLREGRVRATFSRCVVDRRKTGIFLYREQRGLPAGAAVAGAVWDGRYEIVRSEEDGGRVRAVEETEGEAASLPKGILGALRATMPQLGSPELKAVPVLGPWRWFLPCFDLALARRLAGLVGASEIPAPPFAGHNGKEA